MKHRPVVLLFLLIFIKSSSLPIPSLANTEATKKDCVFKNYDSKEPHAFPPASRTTVSCDNTLLSFKKIYEKRDDFTINLRGAENVIDLMLARIGTFKDRKFWRTKEKVAQLLEENTCLNHWNELLEDWNRKPHIKLNSKGQDVCNYPIELGTHKGSTPLVKGYVTKFSAFSLLLKYGKIVQVGTGLCTKHAYEVNNLKEEYFSPGSNYPDEHKFDCDLKTVVSAADQKVRNSIIHEFTSKLGYCKLQTIKDYTSLTSSTKTRKVQRTRRLFMEIAGVIAPNEERKLMNSVCEAYDAPTSNVLDIICTEVAKEYTKAADDKQLRLFALASVVNVVSYPELRRYIPNLTEYMYQQAVKHHRNKDLPQKTEKRTYERYDKNEVKKFVSFLTSPFCLISLPYGIHQVTLPDNTKIDIPHTIRLQRHAEIIRMYTAKRKEEDTTCKLLSRTTMFDICHYCYAVRSKALTCVDYFLAAGYESFDLLEKQISDWQDHSFMEQLDGNVLKKKLSDGRLYLRTDFNVALKDHSTILSHCVTYALSDPDNKKFQKKCESANNKAPHTIICERCQLLQDTLTEIETFALRLCELCEGDPHCLENEADDRTIRLMLVKDAVFNIMEMKKHIIRTRYSEWQRRAIVAQLNTSRALVTLDFAQKLLPMKHLETQKDYFGKKGMSYHISHVLSKGTDGSVIDHSYVHILEGSEQNGVAVVAIIVDVLKNISKCGIKEVILRSDNAACYHSTEVLLSLKKIQEQTGVTIERWAFSEPQAGKSACDRKAAAVKNRVRDFVDKNNNVESTSQFFNALVNSDPLPYTTVSSSLVKPFPKSKRKKAITGITSFYDFIPEQDGIRAYTFFPIGEGQLFRYSNYKEPQQIPELKHELRHNLLIDGECDSKFWRSSETLTKRKNFVDNQNSVYYCPEDTCDATFETMGELEAHLLAEIHQDRKLEKRTAKDYAVCEFSEALNGCSVDPDDPIESKIRQSIIDNCQRSGLDSVKEGWAHKGSRENPKITVPAKEFLIKLFEDGAKNKHKLTGAEAVTAMRNAKTSDGKRMFRPKELLRAEQITSFFSRYKRKSALDYEPPKKRGRKPKRQVNADDESLLESTWDIDLMQDELQELQFIEIEEMVDNVMKELKDQWETSD